jgi:hypothetical protein
MLHPDRYFPQEKKLLSNIENRRAARAFGFTASIDSCVRVKRLEGGCLLYTLTIACSRPRRTASQRSAFKGRSLSSPARLRRDNSLALPGIATLALLRPAGVE